MTLKVTKGFFTTRDEVLEDLKRTGHWPTTFVSGASAELPLHWHDLDVTGYVISGGTYLLDEFGNRTDIEPGDKLELPAGSIHAEGAVKETTVYIVGTETPGQLIEQLSLNDPADPSRPL
jgi:mannose-6-phosphate isomerase-like protein (cupin superfamily)